MIDDIVEAYSVHDITADEIANVRVIKNDMHFHYWAWQLTPCGVLQKVLVARCRMPLAGVHSSRPMITAALQGQEPKLYQYPVAAGAAH